MQARTPCRTSINFLEGPFFMFLAIDTLRWSVSPILLAFALCLVIESLTIGYWIWRFVCVLLCYRGFKGEFISYLANIFVCLATEALKIDYGMLS